jgi:hypothetical protein
VIPKGVAIRPGQRQDPWKYIHSQARLESGLWQKGEILPAAFSLLVDEHTPSCHLACHSRTLRRHIACHSLVTVSLPVYPLCALTRTGGILSAKFKVVLTSSLNLSPESCSSTSLTGCSRFAFLYHLSIYQSRVVATLEE